MDNIFLIEDHDEALKIWQKNKVRGLDLVHIDAHIDFGFHLARPIQEVIKKAKSLKELKRNLEYSLAFIRYEKDFDRQTNIGNYIYPAMEAGIVKDFYWVVPGGLKEFKESLKLIKGMLKNLAKQSNYPFHSLDFELKDGLISANLFGRRFFICILEKLPHLRQKVLLDIDTDFLVIDCLQNAVNTVKIGKRKPWILPKDLIWILKKKIRQPEIITIAYSVNGGFTPMIHKHLGDEIAYYFTPQSLRKHYKNKFKAAQLFNLFVSTNKKEYYQKAVRIEPSYRAGDNNYGTLYLSLRKFSKARGEFLRILRADLRNPACLWGLGNIALEKRQFRKAKKYFSLALNSGNHKLFNKIRSQSLCGLAQAEFRLNNLRRAKELFLRYQEREPLEPSSRFFLARLYEKERDFLNAAREYQHAMRLGLNNIDIISRLLKISLCLEEKDNIIEFVTKKYKEFKKQFLRTKRLSLKRNKKIKGLKNLENKLLSLEKQLTQCVLKIKG